MSEDIQFDREEFAKLKRQTWDATNYGSWFKPARGQVIDTLEKAALEKALAGRSYEKVLDVGIGNGRLLPIYAPHAAHVTGMDISSEQRRLTCVIDCDSAAGRWPFWRRRPSFILAAKAGATSLPPV